jgi:hypothetical protein
MSPNETSRMFRPLDDVSFGRCVLWTMCPLDDVSFGRCVPWTMCPLDDASLGRCVRGRCVLWTIRPLDDASPELYVPWTMLPLDYTSLGRCVPTLDQVRRKSHQLLRSCQPDTWTASSMPDLYSPDISNLLYTIITTVTPHNSPPPSHF